MSKIKNLKLALVVISVIISSIYLTFLIDTYTLNTWLKRAFVFCYFIIMGCLAFYLYNKSKKHKHTLIPLLCAVIAVVFAQGFFLPAESEHTIYLQSVETAGEEKEIKEVWFVDAEADGQHKPLSKLAIGDNVQWGYEHVYDDYFFHPSENSKENRLSFTVVGEKITLRFGANNYSGSVRIYDYEGYDEIISLYSEDTENDSITHTLNLTRSFSIFERILLSVGAVITVCFAFKVLIWALLKLINRKKTKPNANKA